jgi:Lrp/AsnC family leucine-responsive transcriptional regulator
MPKTTMDEIDLLILQALQRDARISNADLAEAVGLSPSPCLRRVRSLEQRGILRGYRADLDRVRVGLGLTAFVAIKVERHQVTETAPLTDAIVAMPEVISCHLVSGDADLLLQVVVPSLEYYEDLLFRALLKLPGIVDIKTSFALHTYKADAPLPIPKHSQLA